LCERTINFEKSEDFCTKKSVAQLGYPAPWGKKYFCAPRQQKLQNFEVKNRYKSAEKAKAKHLLELFCSFLRVMKRI